MKLNRILFAALIASVTGSSITSCSESFLDEILRLNIVQTVLKPRKVLMNW